ncbi:MAG TPA: tetratricopeptide repeat protein [Pirellulales bacterium]|nr:tetratricopeptide repeat protein [Pirellulales bacterium]
MTTADLFAPGRHWQQLGDLPRAEEAYRESLLLAPANAELWCSLASVCKGQGKYDQAFEAYQRAMAIDPDFVRAHNGLGIALLELGRLTEAATCLERAVRLDPGFAAAYNNLGNVYLAQGRKQEALACYQQAVLRQPQFAEAHGNLGNAWRELNQFEPALRHCEEAVALKPGFAIGHNHLGAVYLALGRYDHAVESFHQALRLAPSYFEARFNLGTTLHKLRRLEEAAAHLEEAVRLQPGSGAAHATLALVLFEQRKLDEAAQSYQRALGAGADEPDIHNNLGVVYSNLRRWEEAARCYRRAIALRENYPEAHRNLGCALRESGQLDEAVSVLREALRWKPDFAEAQASLSLALVELGDLDAALASCEAAMKLNLNGVAANSMGIVFFEMGRREEALACYQQSLVLDPNSADARKNRAILRLLEGKLPEGWHEYEWRWKCAESPAPPFAQPLWDGSPLAGRTILLHTEQGLGDTLHFIRYAQLVQQRGGRVIVACQPPLVPLLGRSRGIERIVAQGDPLPPCDVHAPLLSLPRIFGTTLENIPATTPYLEADPRLVDRWREKLTTIPGFKVGIAWQGSRTYRHDRGRSVPLAAFAPLASLSSVRLISLQKGDGSEQLAGVAGRFDVLDLGGRLDEVGGAFMDTAAVMKNLDLVITSDTAIPHLAGALGVPVWVALSHVPDWRWFLDRDESPWYPTMVLFRQARRGDWQGVFERIATALQAKLAGQA